MKFRAAPEAKKVMPALIKEKPLPPRADSSDDEIMTARSTVERPGRMSGGRDPLSRFGY